MALTTKLELRQSQQLVMTPQLQQAIRLLQLSNLELTQYVDIELERNPLLERVDTVDDGADSPAERGDRIDGQGDGDDYAASARSDNAGDSGLDAGSGTRDHDQGDNSPVEFGLGDRGGREANVAEGGPGIPTASDGEPGERIPEEGRAGDTGGDEAWLDLASPKTDAAAAFDTEYDNVYPDDSGSDSDAAGWAGLRTRDGSFGGDESNLEAYVAADLSLKDHLTAQLPLVVQDAAERLIGQYLIDLVDDAGYVPRDVDQISDKLGASPDMVEAVIVKMQAMDPPGCFARSLGECLALQLKDQNRYDPIIAALLDNLELLARHDLGALRRAVGVDMDELAEMIQEIKHLNPKPGLKFGTVQMQPVVPDVFVRPAQDGSWHVELNSDTLPRVLVNRSYYTKVCTKTASVQDKGYLLECLQTANWLVKSLDQRARTILRVSEEIVRQQDGFFTHGVQHLRPLNLKTVADAIQMHESTVSRVTSNKYLASPRGIFELKYFFTSSIANSDDGEAHSSEAVRFRIKQLIDGETAKSVLSDDKIVERLKSDGIDIARRTVAKYREAMRIPSSVQRRREKQVSERVARTC